MYEDLSIRYDGGEPCVSGRELHEVLNVPKPYGDWFSALKGFKKGKDYRKEYADHLLSLGMAKEICRRRGEEDYADYLGDIERGWRNTPQIMREELVDAVTLIEMLSANCVSLRQKLYEANPKRTYYDVVLENEEPVSTSEIAKDYGITTEQLNEVLYRRGILRRINGAYSPTPGYTNQGYTVCGAKVYWLQKGRLLIYDSLKKDGILPEVEK